MAREDGCFPQVSFGLNPAPRVICCLIIDLLTSILVHSEEDYILNFIPSYSIYKSPFVGIVRFSVEPDLRTETHRSGVET